MLKKGLFKGIFGDFWGFLSRSFELLPYFLAFYNLDTQDRHGGTYGDSGDLIQLTFTLF